MLHHGAAAVAASKSNDDADSNSMWVSRNTAARVHPNVTNIVIEDGVCPPDESDKDGADSAGASTKSREEPPPPPRYLEFKYSSNPYLKVAHFFGLLVDSAAFGSFIMIAIMIAGALIGAGPAAQRYAVLTLHASST